MRITPSVSHKHALAIVLTIALLLLALGPISAQQHGGTVTIAEWEREYPVNPHMRGGYGFQPAVSPVLERLISFDATGTPTAVLAIEVPTFDNGGISEDGRTITFNLRPGVKFADGEDFTCDDVKFTIEAVQNPDNIVTTRAGYNLIDSVDCVDDLTAVFNYSQFYSAWMTIPWYVLPEHILGTEPNWNEHEWNNMPLGTGPFYFCESVLGSHYKWCKNEHYWREGLPYLDEIIVLVVPDREAIKARLQAGDYAMAYGLSELDVPEFTDSDTFHLYLEGGARIEELPLVQALEGVPHRILSDINVRRAIEMAIPKQVIVDDILYGIPDVAASHVTGGWGFNPDIAASEYNPELAGQMLDEAGWTDSDGDGVRDKDGIDMSMTLMGSTARYRLLYMQLIQQELGDIGVKIEILTPEPSLRWAPFDEGGLARTAGADIQAWGNSYEIDPTVGLNQFYRCDQVPSNDNPTFWNVTRWCNEDFEAALDLAESSMDFEEKRAALQRAVGIMNEELVTIPLFERVRISVFNSAMVGGFVPEGGPNGWEYPATYAYNWYLPE